MAVDDATAQTEDEFLMNYDQELLDHTTQSSKIQDNNSPSEHDDTSLNFPASNTSSNYSTDFRTTTPGASDYSVEELFPSIATSHFSSVRKTEHVYKDDNLDSRTVRSESSNIPLTVEQVAIVSEQPTTSASLRISRYKESGNKADVVSQTKESRSKGILPKRIPREKTPNIIQFLLQTISNPMHNPTIIRWENKKKGSFNIVDGEALAHKWAKAKRRKKSVKYESLTRAMRYYYIKGHIKRKSKVRYVYQFGEPSKWKEFLQKQHSSETQLTTSTAETSQETLPAVNIEDTKHSDTATKDPTVFREPKQEAESESESEEEEGEMEENNSSDSEVETDSENSDSESKSDMESENEEKQDDKSNVFGIKFEWNK